MTTPKKRLNEYFSRVAKALASAGRLELLECLAQGERSVDALAREVGASVSNTSHHLQVMRAGGLVRSRKAGQQVIYSLSDSEITLLLSSLQRIAERHLGEVERIVRESFGGRDELTPVRREELRRMMSKSEAVVIDVRPEAEFAAGHIRGAINIPVSRLAARARALPRDREIVAYCRGPYCMLAVDAVSRLRRKGYSARRLEDGYPEWAARGLPVTGRA